MTAEPLHVESTRPFVAVICAAPLLAEALASALDSIATVQAFPAHRGDVAGLLTSLDPDAVVVDCEDEAEAAAVVAREKSLPLVHVQLRRRRLRVFENGGWNEPSSSGASINAIRNVVIAGLFGRNR